MKPLHHLVTSRVLLALGATLSLGLGFLFPATPASAQMETEPSDTFTTVSNPLVGKPLADWGGLRFVDAPTYRSLQDFRGHPFIVRFWMAGCPRCRASAATLSDWARRYENQGLEVVAILLPKKGNALPSEERVRSLADGMGWQATLASDDEDWSALRKLWAGSGPRYAVSVGILVDRDGIVRAVHHGGFFSETRAETKAFRATLEQVLAEQGSRI